MKTTPLKSTPRGPWASRQIPRLRLGALALCLVLLAGCAGVFSTGPAPKRMFLNPEPPAQITGTKTTRETQIIVSLPTAWLAVDTDAIALLFPNREIRYLSGVRWAGTVPGLVQSFLIDALGATGAFQGVAGDSTGISSQVRLACDIRQFLLRYDDPNQPPTAVFDATFRLINLRNGEIISTLPLLLTAPATGTSAQDLVNASEKVMSEALGKVAAWSVASISAK